MISRIDCNVIGLFACVAFVSLAASPGHAAPTLTLTEAQRIAAVNAPQLQAQSAAVRAAEAAGISAGEWADPKLIVGLDNLPVDGADRFSVARDFMTMRLTLFL